MIEYVITSVNNIEDFDIIAKEHWDSFQNKHPKFDKDILSQFKVIQAKDKDTTVGYVLFIVFKSPYYDELWCQIDMFYLKPEYRNKNIGYTLFSKVEEEAKKAGALKIMSSFNIKQPLEGFYTKLGYSKTHVAVAKEL